MGRSRACDQSGATVSFGLKVHHESRVEVIEDTKIPNAATIKIVKQDHTLGNMLRAYALSPPRRESMLMIIISSC